MYSSSLDEGRNRQNEIKLVTAALYEAKVKDDEILRVLMKVCDIDRERAINAFQYEKFLYYPCRNLYQYLSLEKGFSGNDADIFVIRYARSALSRNAELSKLSPAKLFEAINKANK